jgi:hypothetical protein
MNITKRVYKITVNNQTKTVKSSLFAFDVCKQFYNDIMQGEYLKPYAMRFYSPKNGYVYVNWDVD